MNPALGARCFLMISFAARMTTFTYDGVTTATPLAVMEQGKSVDVMKSFLQVARSAERALLVDDRQHVVVEELHEPLDRAELLSLIHISRISRGR